MCGKSEKDQMGLWHQDWEEYGESLQLALGGAGVTDSSSEETEELTEEAIKTVTNEKTLEKIGKGVIRWIGKIKVMRKEIQKVHANYKEQDLMKDLRIEE